MTEFDGQSLEGPDGEAHIVRAATTDHSMRPPIIPGETEEVWEPHPPMSSRGRFALLAVAMAVGSFLTVLAVLAALD